jgi:hypothetical protein
LFPEFFIAENLGAGSDFLGPELFRSLASNYLDPAPFSPARDDLARDEADRSLSIWFRKWTLKRL